MNPRENDKPEDKSKATPSAPEKTEHATENLVDAELEMTFPASDPPSYMGGSAIAGPPPKKGAVRPGVTTEVSDAENVKPEKPSTTAECEQDMRECEDNPE